MLSIDQVYKNIIQNKFTYVKIIDSRNDVIGIFYGLNNKVAKPQEVNSYIREFIEQQPGIYTFELKRYATAKNSSAIRYKEVNCFGNNPIKINFDFDKEREDIRRRIEEEEREKRSKINYEEKVKELDTVAGMLSHIVKEVFVHFKTKNTPTGNLQGMATTSSDPVAPENFTPEQIKMANEGLAKIMKVMSPELFYQIACKLEQNPDKVSAIKTFL